MGKALRTHQLNYHLIGYRNFLDSLTADDISNYVWRIAGVNGW